MSISYRSFRGCAPLMMLALASIPLAGCASSKLDARPVIELASPAAAPPASLVAPCDSPVEFAAGALGAGTVEFLWSSDRAALAACGGRHKAVVEFYRERDAGLAGER